MPLNTKQIISTVLQLNELKDIKIYNIPPDFYRNLVQVIGILSTITTYFAGVRGFEATVILGFAIILLKYCLDNRKSADKIIKEDMPPPMKTKFAQAVFDIAVTAGKPIDSVKELEAILNSDEVFEHVVSTVVRYCTEALEISYLEYNLLPKPKGD